jgi:ribosomal protein S18 acetylase RimI-like enzyme
MMIIRKARASDIAKVGQSYTDLLLYERENGSTSNWVLGLYPTISVAETAFRSQTLYVLVVEDKVCGSMILNHLQPEEYQRVEWQYIGNEDEILVLHTLCIPPDCAGRGYGQKMVDYALNLALEQNLLALRLDTWEGNKPAAALYTKMGLRYAGTTHALFQGAIPCELIFFEKSIRPSAD